MYTISGIEKTLMCVYIAYGFSDNNMEGLNSRDWSALLSKHDVQCDKICGISRKELCYDSL